MSSRATMKILYDHQVFAIQKRGGASRYFSVLIQKMNEFTGATTELALVHSDNQHLKEGKSANAPAHDLFSSHKNIWDQLRTKLRTHKLAVRAYNSLKDLLNKKHTRARLVDQNFDVFHPTHFDPYFLDVLGKKPFVLTVHDMIHELFPKYFSPNHRDVLGKKILAERATRIIAISENTKNDIVRLLGISPGKISVVYHANFLNPEHEEKIVLPTRFLLYVGGRKRYKNFAFYVESIAEILKKDKDLFVVCFGGEEFAPDEIELFESLSIADKILHTGGNDAQLIFAYKHAIAFVFPSLYEGFGLPILEAFSCGCPVLLSDASCFPEIAGDAGAYFNGEDKQSIADATREIIENRKLRDVLREAGFRQLKNFSVEKMVRETYQVYEACVS